MDVVKEYFTTLDETFWILLTFSNSLKTSNKYAQVTMQLMVQLAAFQDCCTSGDSSGSSWYLQMPISSTLQSLTAFITLP